MKTRSALIITCVLWTGMAAFSQGATIFSDTFDTGTGNWYRAGVVGNLTNTNSQLSWTPADTQNRQTIGRSFTATTVAVGETLRMSFNYTQSAASVGILRVGMYNLQETITADGWSGGDTNIGGTFAGFTTFVRDASADGNNARYETGSITTSTAGGPIYAGTDMVTPANSTNYDINQTGAITYNVTFEITRNAGSVTTLFTMASGGTTHYSIAATTSAATALNINDFDMVGIRSGGGTTVIDNFVVELVPEPSAVLLSGIGLTALISRRQRKS